MLDRKLTVKKAFETLFIVLIGTPLILFYILYITVLFPIFAFACLFNLGPILALRRMNNAALTRRRST